MKRPLPLWIAAAVPAALAGHGFAYALSGQNSGTPQHAWVAPALECSIALFAALGLVLIGGALLRAGIFMHTAAERSVRALWPRLAAAQMLIFAAMECAEGSHLRILGFLVQIAVALAAASLLSLFARLLARCIRHGITAAYVQRAASGAAIFIAHEPLCFAHALAVRAGTARFQRPPPNR